MAVIRREVREWLQRTTITGGSTEAYSMSTALEKTEPVRICRPFPVSTMEHHSKGAPNDVEIGNRGGRDPDIDTAGL